MLVLKIYWVFWWKLRLAFEIKTAKIGQSAPLVHVSNNTTCKVDNYS